MWHVLGFRIHFNVELFHNPLYYDVLVDPAETDKMTAEGIMRFLDDLSLSPESKLVLIIAWKFRAATQCEFTRDEFMSGMTDVG
jgi:DCN1-like protein 1/2